MDNNSFVIYFSYDDVGKASMYIQTEKVNHGCHQTGRLRTFFEDANKNMRRLYQTNVSWHQRKVQGSLNGRRCRKRWSCFGYKNVRLLVVVGFKSSFCFVFHFFINSSSFFSILFTQLVLSYHGRHQVAYLVVEVEKERPFQATFIVIFIDSFCLATTLTCLFLLKLDQSLSILFLGIVSLDTQLSFLSSFSYSSWDQGSFNSMVTSTPHSNSTEF